MHITETMSSVKIHHVCELWLCLFEIKKVKFTVSFLEDNKNRLHKNKYVFKYVYIALVGIFYVYMCVHINVNIMCRCAYTYICIYIYKYSCVCITLLNKNYQLFEGLYQLHTSKLLQVVRTFFL